MKLPSSLEAGFARFDRLKGRERVLVCLAVLAAAGMTWMTVFQDPITAKRRALAAEMSSLRDSLNSADVSAADQNDPAAIARRKAKDLHAKLDAMNKELTSAAAGLIPPERMVQVIHDVLVSQHGVVLVSLHNKPVLSLVDEVPTAPMPTAASDSGAAAASVERVESGPYIHPVEIIVEGSYLDILRYLQALEALPWHFYWKILQLDSGSYPLNRVRIELSTLSMDKEWLGV